MQSPSVSEEVSCAIEIFLAAALLHREHPEREDFTIGEIVNRAAKENIRGEMRAGLNVHASQHCVANRAPNPARHRMLFATGKHTRRLLLPGDDVHPDRTGRVFPEPGDVPERYLPLLDWARSRYEAARRETGMGEETPAERVPAFVEKQETESRWLESLFELEGLGKEYWKDVDPDEFVRQLREGWQ